MFFKERITRYDIQTFMFNKIDIGWNLFNPINSMVFIVLTVFNNLNHMGISK